MQMAPGVQAEAPPGTRASLVDRLLAARDRCLANTRFQRWAARFAPTRGIARRRARQVFDLVAGFVYSQVLFACVKLGVFELLAEAPRTASALAPRIGLSDEATERLLVAAAAIGLLERRSGQRFGLGALAAPIVGNAGLRAMIEHHAVLYADLADPVALLRGQGRDAALGSLGSFWPYAQASDPAAAGEEQVAAYSALMSASQPLVAGEVLDAYPLDRHRCLLDVGGGEGAFLVAAAARAPQLRLMLFDLPAVTRRAEARFAAAGLAARASSVGGSFLVDALPAGADVVSLVRVLHDHDDARVLALLRAVRRALPAGGTLLVAEPMAETPGAEPMGDAYFGFYLLAMGRGRPRSAARLTGMLRETGFVDVRLRPTAMPLQTQLIVARAPSA